MGGKRWSEEELNDLKQMNENNIPLKTMAKELGRTEYAVQNKLNFGLGILLKNSKKNFNHIYEVGEEVNGMKIIKQIRSSDRRSSIKSYIVESLAFPEAPHYEISESNIRQSKRCAYSRGIRIFEGNSLYSITRIRNNIIDIEYAKKIAPNHSNLVLFKCENKKCGHTRKMKPSVLVKNGFACPICSKGVSYPENMFISYVKAKNIPYEYQVKFEDSLRRIDFKIFIDGTPYFVECNGLQHYENIGWKDAYVKTKESDKIKLQYANSVNTRLIELDCRESTFEFIKKQINNNEYLPNIKKEDELLMLKIMSNNERFPIVEIVEKYTVKKIPIAKISEELRVSTCTIARILSNQKIELRGNTKKVKCIETGHVFMSVKDANLWCGLTKYSGLIGRVCKGERQYGGKHPITGEKLRWEYVDNE